MGFVLRLMGRLYEGLSYLIQAEKQSGGAWLRTDQAACTLLMGDLERTRTLLEGHPPQNPRSRK